MELISKKQCPKCNAEVSEVDYFCSHCGKSLKSKPADTSVSKQALVYFVSLFIAPFGLGYAFKYLRESDKKAKIIGVVSLILTIVAMVAVIIISKKFFEGMYSSLNLINSGLY